MITCGECEFYDPLGANFCTGEFYENAGECRNEDVWEDCNSEKALVRAGGSDGYGDYFHVRKDFGCVKGRRK